MKLFKRFSLFAITILSLIGLTGCGSDEVSGNLEDLMTKLYQEIPEDENPALMNTEVIGENVEYFLGTTDIEYEEGLASEPMMGSIAHSVVLLRAKENANIEEIKNKIKENVDPRKWICVEVAKEDVIVKNRGNLIILIMVEDKTTREKIEKGFDNL